MVVDAIVAAVDPCHRDPSATMQRFLHYCEPDNHSFVNVLTENDVLAIVNIKLGDLFLTVCGARVGDSVLLAHVD